MSSEKIAKFKADMERKKLALKKAKKKKANREYYLKHKVKKKRTIKKNKIEKPVSEPPVKGYYKIMNTSLNMRLKWLDIFHSLDKSLLRMDELDREFNMGVRFPTKYIIRNHKIHEAKYELVLLKKREDGEDNIKLKNDMGQYVEHVVIDKDRYIIIDKRPYNVEETFFVYGYHPKFQRKDFSFILNEILLDCKCPIKSVVCYRNKLIIEHDNDMDIVMCKNTNDVHRLYSELQDELKDIKSGVIFKGIIPLSSHLERVMRQKIMDKTGWNDHKVRRLTTRP